MGVGLAGVGVLLDQKRIHPVGKGQGGDVSSTSGELPRPNFQSKPVLNDQVCTGCTLNITGRGLVAVNF